MAARSLGAIRLQEHYSSLTNLSDGDGPSSMSVKCARQRSRTAIATGYDYHMLMHENAAAYLHTAMGLSIWLVSRAGVSEKRHLGLVGYNAADEQS